MSYVEAWSFQCRVVGSAPLLMLTAVGIADMHLYDGIMLLSIIVLDKLTIGLKEKVHKLSRNIQFRSTTVLFEADFAILDRFLA